MADYLLYWFMLPFSTLVATTAMLGGIGGAAMFMPIFLIIFPLLGPQYIIAGPVAAIGVALLTESFGFSSGLIGYLRRGLIDFRMAKSLIIIGVPAGIVGAFLSHMADPNTLKITYGILMFTLAYFILRRPKTKEKLQINQEALSGKYSHIGHERDIVAKDGKEYKYHLCHPGKGKIATGIGGFLTGLMSVGIGEVVMPQLVKTCKVPIAVAAASSVLVVIVTVMAASFTHIYELVAQGGFNAVPWNLIIYTAPGVILGGQIGSRLQGRVPSEKMEKIVAVLFIVIGISMTWIVLGK